MEYPSIQGTEVLTYSVLPPPGDEEPLPAQLKSPTFPTANSKSIFAFWHSGIANLPPYLLRNVVAWYQRFSPFGWTIYVLDAVPKSSLNVSRFIDTSSSAVVPDVFRSGALGGTFAAQHTSDLIRYPLLLKYGGIYLDVGILQFGDLDWLWTTHVSNPSSPYDFAGFTMGDSPRSLSIVNFAFMCVAENPLVLRAHQILLKLWEGTTGTDGMHTHPLVRQVPLLTVGKEVIVEHGGGTMVIDDKSMTDYAIQIQAMGAAERWVDADSGWDGPKYVCEKCWLLSMVEMAYVSERMTGWSGQRAFDLFSLNLPLPGMVESDDQRLAREIVENSVGGSWCLKLMHGFSAKLFGGDTLGILWKKHEGSDAQEGTYAGWMRWAQVHCKQVKPIQPLEIGVFEPTMVGRLTDQL